MAAALLDAGALTDLHTAAGWTPLLVAVSNTTRSKGTSKDSGKRSGKRSSKGSSSKGHRHHHRRRLSVEEKKATVGAGSELQDKLTDGLVGRPRLMHREAIALLVQAGADMNLASQPAGLSPLFVAADNGSVDCVGVSLRSLV